MKCISTALPDQPCKSFKEWSIFILGQVAIYEGRAIENSDIKKPFTINQKYLEKVLEVKWMEQNYPPYLWDKGRYEKYKKGLIATQERVDEFYAKRKNDAGIIG